MRRWGLALVGLAAALSAASVGATPPVCQRPVAHGHRSSRTALPRTVPPPHVTGAAGPPPLGAAGPPPLGAAGPPPLGAAGPPPVGAAGARPRIVERELPRQPHAACVGEECPVLVPQGSAPETDGAFDGARDFGPPE